MNWKCQHDCNGANSGPESSSQQTVSDDHIYWGGIKGDPGNGKEIIYEVDVPFYCINLEFGQDDDQYIEHGINEYKNGVNP
jgi:hypothetical protein